MRRSFSISLLFLGAVFCVVGLAQTRQRLNPMIDLLEQKKPVFGVYWPGNPQGRRGGPPPAVGDDGGVGDTRRRPRDRAGHAPRRLGLKVGV